jgi:concentrative nucleoside transporter, CNT family
MAFLLNQLYKHCIFLGAFLIILFSSCKKQISISDQITKTWTSTIVGKTDTLQFLKSGQFIWVDKRNGISSKGKYSIGKDSTLALIYDLKPINMDVDSVIYSVNNGNPVISYFKNKTPIAQLTVDGLQTDRLIKSLKIKTCSDNTLVLTDNDQKNYQFSYNATVMEGKLSLNSILRGIMGMLVLVGILYLLSSNKRSIPWKLVVSGIGIQILFAICILKVPFIASGFDYVSNFFVLVLDFTKQGSLFVFGNLLDTKTYGFVFAFQILPTILFFSALTSLFYYLGILQKIVYGLAWLLGKTMKISGAENLSTAANIFLGQTEAPLMIKPFLEKMTKSEMLCIMVGGMANTAGGVLASYVGFLGGDDPVQQLFFAKHLLAASVMSAPATLVISKMLIPQTEEIDEKLELSKEKLGANVLEAIANGTTDGLKLAVNVAAMLIVFIALMAMVNYVLKDVIGDATGLNKWVYNISDQRYEGFTLQAILGYICSPITYAIGICKEDMLLVGQLLGEKTVLNEFNAYISMSGMKAGNLFTENKSIIMSTYILSGFANFASIGIQIGGIGSLAPNKRSMLSELGIKALIGGTIASLFTATIVGMLI